MSEVPSHGRKSLFTAIWMGRYWQQNQFWSSFCAPNGREISFGVVRLVDLRPNALYLVRKPTLSRKNFPDWGFRGQISRFYYSETRLAASRELQVLRNSFCCQTSCAALTRAPDVSQVCNLGERWRRYLLALSVPTGPRTHPLRRCQRDGSKRAQ